MCRKQQQMSLVDFYRRLGGILLQYVNELIYNAWCVTYISKVIDCIYKNTKFKSSGLQWVLGQS